MTTPTNKREGAAPGNDDIRRIFLAHGFTIKEGQTDLKPYVYEAACALIAEVLAVPAVVVETLQGIATADWREWQELASAEDFVRWAKSRANHALAVLEAAPTAPAAAEPPLLTDEQIDAALAIPLGGDPVDDYDRLVGRCIEKAVRKQFIGGGFDVEELRRALCAIGVVGEYMGKDTILRESVLDVLDQRIARSKA